MLGKTDVKTRVSGFRQHISIMHICCANGKTIPPLYVFTGKNTGKNLLYGAPEGKYTTSEWKEKPGKNNVFHVIYHVLGSRFSMQESGYFTSKTFPDTIRHLMANSPPGKKLFILDGHDSHLDVDAFDL